MRSERAGRVERAALNNAVWCDAVCRAHGAAGELYDTVWRNLHPSPPFYPNLITLRDIGDPSAALEQIGALEGRRLPRGWGVKDSFCSLDLGRLDFDLLFEASWIWRAEDQSPEEPGSDLRWSPVTSPAELSRWTAASQRPFPASLLADPDVVLLAGRRGSELVAGGILNLAADVVGLSNVFAAAGDLDTAWRGLVTAARVAFPGRPLAGYEHGASLGGALASGFEALGALRVWLRRQGDGV